MTLAPVLHKTIGVGGVETFYREAGQEGSPVVLLPHGYPCSSFQYRNFMPALADRWRLIAPDYPGFGYSATPGKKHFSCTFDGYADWLERFTEMMNISRYAIYLHDYGSQIGLRLAMKAPLSKSTKACNPGLCSYLRGMAKASFLSRLIPRRFRKSHPTVVNVVRLARGHWRGLAAPAAA